MPENLLPDYNRFCLIRSHAMAVSISSTGESDYRSGAVIVTSINSLHRALFKATQRVFGSPGTLHRRPSYPSRLHAARQGLSSCGTALILLRQAHGGRAIGPGWSRDGLAQDHWDPTRIESGFQPT